jgi:hypothetical protein
MRPHLRSLRLSILIPFLVAACASSAPQPTPSAPPGGGVDSAAAAAARVFAAYPQFAAIGPFRNDMIGQCCWYEAAPVPDGYTVKIHVGWGDCPAGCIEKHEWTFKVSATDGSITLVSETGTPVPPGVPGASGSAGGAGSSGITGKVVAGPTCPVVRANDPSCNPRPVAGAVVVVRSVDGTEVARVQADGTGSFQAALPPGSYTVGGDQSAGFPGPPPPIAVTVVANTRTPVQLLFDTGIR